MADPIVISPVSGKLTCKCVGSILEFGGKILMLDRKKGVLGWACPAGHMDIHGEDWSDCESREVMEEVGINFYTNSCKLRSNFDADINNRCSRGAAGHWWRVNHYVFNQEPLIKLGEPDKHRGIGWFRPEELEMMELEPVWRAILQRVGILKNYVDPA